MTATAAALRERERRGELYSDDAAGWEQDWNAEDSYIAIPPGPVTAAAATAGGG
jgi:hypothetical protein